MLKTEKGLTQYVCTWISPTKLRGEADNTGRHEDLEVEIGSTRILKS